jgi:hypothetical protein
VRSIFTIPDLGIFSHSHLDPTLFAQEKSEGPTDAKARKTYEKALKYLHEHNTQSAFEPPAAADDTPWG